MSERIYCVYIHINKINGKAYIGQTNNIENRWKNNGIEYKPKKNGKSRFWNAIKSYGWDSFDHKIIASSLTSDDADALEIELIKRFDLLNPENGYNLLSGGKGGAITKPIHCNELNKDFISISCAARELGLKNSAISMVCRGKMISTGGYSFCFFDEELKEKAKSKRIQIEVNKRENGIKNISVCWESNKKPILCVETGEVFDCIKDANIKYGVDNIGRVCKGEILTCAGMHWKYLDEKDTPIRKHLKNKQIICIETNEIFESIAEAARNKKICESAINECCRHKRKSAGKLHWEYYEEV